MSRCKHSNVECLGENLDKDVLWCSDCGAQNSDTKMGYDAEAHMWQSPHSSTPELCVHPRESLRYYPDHQKCRSCGQIWPEES